MAWMCWVWICDWCFKARCIQIDDITIVLTSEKSWQKFQINLHQAWSKYPSRCNWKYSAYMLVIGSKSSKRCSQLTSTHWVNYRDAECQGLQVYAAGNFDYDYAEKTHYSWLKICKTLEAALELCGCRWARFPIKFMIGSLIWSLRSNLSSLVFARNFVSQKFLPQLTAESSSSDSASQKKLDMKCEKTDLS